MESFELIQRLMDGGLLIPIALGAGVIGIFIIISYWIIFQKAGQPGWATIIPVYNTYIMIKIAGKPQNWFYIYLACLLGGFVPVIGAIASIASVVLGVMIAIGIAEKFGKSQGFGVGLGLLSFIFAPILAFSDAQYQGTGDFEDQISEIGQ